MLSWFAPSPAEDDGEVEARESSMFQWAGMGERTTQSESPPRESLSETLASLLGNWSQEADKRQALRDVNPAWHKSVLNLTQPDAEEQFLEAQEEEEDESSEAAPKPPDTSSLPASFHVVAAEDRTKIASEVVSYCTPAQFWRTTFSDDSKALRTQFLETEMHCWNVNIGRWAPHPDLGICRLTTYEVDTHAPIGPQQTRVLEYEAVDRDGELARFTHRSVVRILDATFGDHYQVETTVSVDEETGGGTAYSMEFGIHFSKRIPMWGIESLVRNTWKAKNTASAKVYLGMAKKQLRDAPPPPLAHARSALYSLTTALVGETPPLPPPKADDAAPPEAPVAVSGLLEKHSRRTIFAHWRTCTLREDGVFLWARSKGDRRVLGSVNVVGGHVEKVDHDSLDFKLTRANKNWFRLVAKTPADCDKWVYLLDKATKRAERSAPPAASKRTGVHGVERRYSFRTSFPSRED